MNELVAWLDTQKITYRPVDSEVVEIPGLGRMFLADLSGVKSIFRTVDGQVQFNLMEDPAVLIGEGIHYVTFPFGDNWYYYDLREEFRFNILKYVGQRRTTAIDVPFVNLGVHTSYELLNGSGDIAQWVRKAKYLGHSALGICDCNSMAGTLELQKECAKAGMKHIFGYTFTFEYEGDDVEAKIYCQSQQGLRNLLRVQKQIMVDSPDNKISAETLLHYAVGNVLVMGKLSPEWMTRSPHVVMQFEEAFEQVYYQVDPTEYKADRLDVPVLEAARHYFENFYLPDTDRFVIEPVLICDSYYLDKDDARNKIILNKIASGAAHEQSEEQYYKDVDEHLAVLWPLFDHGRWNVGKLFERMCCNTVRIAEGATARYETEKCFMPRYDLTQAEVKEYGDSHTMFLRLLEEGFKRLVPAGKEEQYRKRLEHEIYILESTDNVDYMLIQYDTVNWARANDILVGCGRGSAGGSLAMFLLGITLIDPIKYDLLFERFLLPERAGLFPAQVTRFAGDLDSRHYVEVELENGKRLRIDKDARLLVKRNSEEVVTYADELIPGDEAVFDNRDILFIINR